MDRTVSVNAFGPFVLAYPLGNFVLLVRIIQIKNSPFVFFFTFFDEKVRQKKRNLKFVCSKQGSLYVTLEEGGIV